MKNSLFILYITSIILLIICVVSTTLLIVGILPLDVVGLFDTFPVIKLILFIIIASILSFFVFMSTSMYRKHVKERQAKAEFENVRIDNLTQMFSFEYFIKLLQRMDNPFTLVLMDVDNFKEINDKFGSVIGDLVLKVIAKSIKENIRYSDIVARYEGDAFLIILDNCPPQYATHLMESIRCRIKENERLSEKHIVLSTSVGMHFVTKLESTEVLLRKTVQALTAAKEDEDKKVVLYEDLELKKSTKEKQV